MHGGLDTCDEPVVDRDPEQQAGDRLRARASVAERVCVTLAVLLMHHLTTARDEEARDLSELVELQVDGDATSVSVFGDPWQ